MGSNPPPSVSKGQQGSGMDTKDDLTWLNCENEDLWIFNKLNLARRLGYVCGPKGVDVPQPGNYVVRPCVNLMGMSKGADIVWIDEETDEHEKIPHGYFWCEIFTGRHLSVDYIDKKQVLCVEGFKHENSLYKFSRWQKTNDVIEYPEILNHLVGNYKYINVEMIGDKIIEVHLRLNPDFADNEQEVIPVWENDSTEAPQGFTFVPGKVDKRIGFFVRK